MANKKRNYNQLARRVARRRVQKTRRKRLFSITARRMLRKSFGRRFMPFFDLYTTLRAVYYGDEMPPEEGFSALFRSQAKRIRRQLIRKETHLALRERVPNMIQLLKRLDRQKKKSGLIFKRIVSSYADLIKLVAEDHDLFFKTQVLKYPGFVRFVKAREEDEEMLRLRRDNPELYEAKKREMKLRKELDQRIEKEVERSGYDVGRKSIQGRVVITGTDRTTGEELVFDRSGEVLPVEDFIKNLKEKDQEVKRLQKHRVFPDEEVLEDQRSFDRELVDKYTTEEGREVTYASLTDDAVKQNALTRIYPVVEIFGEKVITEGRYKGYVLADLINEAGRLIEGTAYEYIPETGRRVRLEQRDDEGNLKVPLEENKEPYMTREGDELFLSVPSSRGDMTEVRRAIRELSKVSDGVNYVEGSRNTKFKISPDEFVAARNALRSFSMSKSATDLVESHFEDLVKSDHATKKENLVDYSTEELGGFKEDSYDLYLKQKETLAWLDARGGNGLVALDTGVGKTLCSIGYIQDLDRQGVLDTQKVLYVSPAKLKGNLQEDAKDWIEDMDRFNSKVEYMSYALLSLEDEDVLDQYAAVIFDEAQHLKNVGTTKRGKIVNREHPRKVLMTASPMQRDPKEAFKLAALANNIDLLSPEGRELKRQFERRFCEKIGSRVVGIKDDPAVQKKLREWVKQNLFYADKHDVEEVTIPHLRPETRGLSMDREVEDMYREIVSDIKFEMEGLVRLYRDKDHRANDPQITGAMVKFKKKMKELQTLSNMPETLIPGVTNPKIEESVNIIDERIEARGKTLLFTSSSDFASHTAREFSLKRPGTLHAAGLSDRIEIWRTGKLIEKYTQRIYRDSEGNKVPTKMWAKHVLDTYVKTDSNIVSCTLTDSYSTGQNLQEFDTVIQLDRAPNAEIQRQRVSRAYRNGQEKSVKEITLDTVYTGSKEDDSSLDRTLDEIKRYIQEMEEDLFDKVIREGQTESLGEDYFAIKNLSTKHLKADKKSFEVLMSPYMEDLRERYEGELDYARPTFD